MNTIVAVLAITFAVGMYFVVTDDNTNTLGWKLMKYSGTAIGFVCVVGTWLVTL